MTIRKWLLRTGIAAGAALVILAAAIYILAGTEGGSRWLLLRVAQFAPVEIDAAGSSGTLMGRLVIPGLRFENAGLKLRVSQLELTVDWSASSLRHVAIEDLSATEVRLQTVETAADAEDSSEISMADLPVGLSADRITVQRLNVNDLEVDNTEVGGFTGTGTTFTIGRARLALSDLHLDATDASVTVDAGLPLRGEFGWRLDGEPWSGRATIGGNLRELSFEHRLEGSYPAHTRGTAFILDEPEPRVDATTEFERWQLQDWTASDGRLRLQGTANDYRATLRAGFARGSSLAVDVRGDVAGNTAELRHVDVLVESENGSIRASGSLAWSPEMHAELAISGSGIDPSAFVSVPGGNVDAELRLTAQSAEDFALRIVSLSGVWNGQRSVATGRLSRNGETWVCDACRVTVGDNRLAVDGQIIRRAILADIDIDAPALGHLRADLAGSLEARGRLSGLLALPILSGTAAGHNIAYGDWMVASLSLQSQASTPENLDLTIELAGLLRAGAPMGGGRAWLAGNSEALQLRATWTLDEFAAETDARIALDGDTVGGTVESARLSEPFTGTWTASAPFAFSFSPGTVEILAAEWANGDSRFEHREIRIDDGLARVSASLSRGPLAALNAFLPDDIRIDGLANATLDVTQRESGWSGSMDWSQQGTRVRLLSETGDDFELAVPVATSHIELQDDAVVLRAAVSAEPGLEATLDASLDGLSPDAGVLAHVQVSGYDWQWIEAMVPDLEDLAGEITADLHASGKLAAPDLSGELRWRDGRFAVPALNLPLRDIDVTLKGTSAGDMTVAGNARSGDGTLQVNGRLDDVTSASPSFSVRLAGSDATLLGWPDYRLTASPDLEFTGDRAGIDVTGQVHLDSAQIRIDELPAGAVKPSPDVHVQGREAAAREATRVSGNVGITLGEDIHIHAFGLDGHLAGQLQFTVPEDREPRGEGELRLVDGFFEAYGQRLEIERGKMLFTGPLDDPLVDVRATRTIEQENSTIIVGLDLNGRAQNMSSSIFSDPSMSKADALSYLMLGRPLEDASAADGNTLANSAYGLGLRQAGLITNQIGQTVGLDELAVTGSNQNTTALVAGKKINSKLYARYAYGVFTKLGKLLLRYRLSDSFSIEVGAGETQSMDILYTIERE